MKLAADSLFMSNPSPMWVYDLETLQFLTVNNAAVAKYGYSREEFLGMTIADIRPAEDRDALVKNVASVTEGYANSGVWRHCLKSGQVIYVDIAGHTIVYEGRRAELIAARDVSGLVIAEQTALDALAREKAARNSSERLAHQFQIMFDSIPGMFLVFSPQNFDVVAVSDELLSVLGTNRADVVGHSLFDILPEQPQDIARVSLRESFERVLTSGEADILAIQVFRVPKGSGPEQAGERQWALSCTPVNGPDGRLVHLILRMRDVTEFITDFGVDSFSDSSSHIERAKQDLIAHTRDLKADNLRLAEMAAKLRTTERLLNTGTWDYVFGEDRLYWSPNVYEIYGVEPNSFDGRFEDYVALVHPDDRSTMRSNFAEFMASGDQSFTFLHRVCHRDGRIVNVQGLAERTDFVSGPALSGVVQDITQRVEASRDLAQAKRLLDIAGVSAKFGAWRYDNLTDILEWSPQTARIHDEPEGFSPSVKEGIAYYAPEHRERIAAQFYSCLADGKPFSDSLEIISAKGRRAWVRVTGEPEHDEGNQIVAIHGSFQDISELVSAQQKADELRGRLAETLEHISDAFMLLDRQFRFLFINKRAASFLELDQHHSIGKQLTGLKPEVFNSAFRDEFERALRDKCLTRFTEYSSSLGKWLSVDTHPMPDGLAVYFRDVTEQRAKEEQLRLLETAASRLNDILLITEAEPISGPDGPKIVYVNDAFERRTGFSRDEVIGKTPRILQGAKTQRAELRRIRKALKNWQPIRTELINYTKSGEEFWLELDIVPLADETGWYTHWVAVERDISERKGAEQALKANEERFRLATKAARTAIWEWDIVADLKWWSEGLQEIFGHPVDKTDRKSTIRRKHVHPDDIEGFYAALECLVSGQDSILDESYRFRRSDGTWAIVEDKAFVLRDDAGNPVRVLGSMSDVTDKKQLEERLRQSQKLEVIGQLTGGIAHDFNNLLTVILGNAEIMTEQLGALPDLQELARMSLEAADRGAQLTSQLLAFSRKQPLEPKVIDVAKLIYGMDGLLRRTLPESIDIEIIRAGGLWHIEADAAQLESAILNLAVNARDAMPMGGCLTLEVANANLDDDYVYLEPELKPGQYVVITVTDTGHGIPRDLLDRIFEPFFTTKEIGKGSGLGLSMVFGLVKQSGGHIRVYSELGEGTSFKLYFPRSQSDQKATVNGQVARKIVGGSERILIVEDDRIVRDHVSKQLRALGYDVFEASGGKEALEVLLQTPGVDLLFTDVVMPGGMSGRELAENARKIRPEIAVLFTSGYTENSIVHEGRLDPGIKLLSKPYRREQLAAKIREALENQ